MILRHYSSQALFRLWVGGLFALAILLAPNPLAAQVWQEDFSGLANGTTSDPGSTAWSIDVSNVGLPGIFEVQSNRLEANYVNTQGESFEAIWISGSIDISGEAAISISANLASGGTLEGGGEDWVRGTYSIDGGSEEEFFRYDGDISGTPTVTANNLSGSSLVIKIYVVNDFSDDYYYINDITVSPFSTDKLYSIANGSWHSGSNWSNTSGGNSCTCVPTATSEVFIENGNQISIGSDAYASILNIQDGDILFSADDDLFIENSGGINISSGSTLDRNGFDARLRINNGSNFSINVEGTGTVINVNEIWAYDYDQIIFSGSGDILIEDELNILGDNSTLINNLSGTFSIGNVSQANIEFNGTAGTVTFINNGVVNINNRIRFNEANHSLLNYGTLTFGGLQGFDNVFIFNNFGTINQNDDFLELAGSEIISNRSGGTWNYAGTTGPTYIPDIDLYCNYNANNFNYTIASGSYNIIIPQDAYWNISLGGGSINRVNENLDINGNLNIASNLTSLGSDTINIAGNLAITGTFNQSSNLVCFDGTEEQTILGLGTISFFRLKVNKSSGELKLLNNVNVTSSLNMSNGNINANANILTLSNSSLSSLSRTNGQVIGKFERSIGLPLPYEFPIGTSTTYNGLYLWPQIGYTGGSVVTEFIATDPGSNGLNVTDNTGPQSIYHQFPEGYWKTYANTFVSNNYKVTLHSNGFTTYTIDNSTRVLHRENGGAWTDPIPGTHSTFIFGEIERTGITNSIHLAGGTTEFALGHISCQSVSVTNQPVNLSNQCIGADVGFKVEATGGGSLDYQWYKNLTPLSDGADYSGTQTDSLTVLSIQASDAANYYCEISNNCSSVNSLNASLGLDGIQPDITCPSDTTVNNTLGSCIVNVTTGNPIISDNCAVDKLTWTITYKASTDNSMGSGINYVGSRIFNVDTSTVTYRVEDVEGNFRECSYEVRVKDVFPPIISNCVNDKDVTLDASCNATLADYTSDLSLVYNDVCDPSPVITQSPVSGTNISDTTLVKVYIADKYGNIDSCSFNVNTIDNTNPVINTCVPDKDVSLDATCSYVLPDYTSELTAITECSNYTITQSPLAGSGISDTTLITLTVTDEYGNLATCSFTVNATDNISPTITSCANDTTISINSSCEIEVPDLTPRVVASDNCTNPGNFTITQSPIAGSMLASSHGANHSVTITVEDEAGNTVNCTTTLTSNDTIKPVFIAIPSDTLVMCNTPDTLKTYTDFVNAGGLANDNCTVNTSTFTLSSVLNYFNGCSDSIVRTYTIADLAGNFSQFSHSITIADTVKPTASNPAATNIACKSAIPPPDVAVVTDEADNCGNTPSVSFISESNNGGIGSTGNPFVVTRTYRVSDDCNNFIDVYHTINVIDNTPPTVITSAPFNVEIDLQSGIATINENDIDNGSSDNCGIESLEIDIDTFYCNDIGNTIPVTLTAKDTAGNTNTGTTDVSVIAYKTTPSIGINMTTDTIICTGNNINIDLSSNSDSTSYSWVFNAPTGINGWMNDSIDYPANGNYTINQTITNTSDTVKLVTLTIRSKLFKRCELTPFDSTLSFWVIPSLTTKLEPTGDTICNNSATSITINSDNHSDWLRFNYTIEPEYPDSISIAYVNINDTIDRVKGYTISDSFTNLSRKKQLIRIISEPYILGQSSQIYCTGIPDTASIWVDPSPEIAASISDTIICSDTEINIAINNTLGSTIGTSSYTLTTIYTADSVQGVHADGTYASGTAITNTLVNTSYDVQKVSYQIVPQLFQNGAYCSNGPDTIINIYVNPRAKISSDILFDTVCNAETIDFNIAKITNTEIGSWAYDISGTTSSPSVSGYTTASDKTDLTFSDVLQQSSPNLQWIEYTFHPKILNPRIGLTVCDNGTANDTTVKIWINPTPQITVTASFDTLCNTAPITFTITNLNPTTSSSWAYDISVVASDGSITGYSNVSDQTDSIITTNLFNPTNDEQWVRYTFTPKIINPRTGTSYCLNGVDTTLQIWINPTPDINVTVSPDTLCNGETVDFTVTNPIAGNSGRWAYRITTTLSDPSLSGYTTTTQDTSVLSISDVLVNPTTELQYIDYKFHPIIATPTSGKVDCENGSVNDTTIRVWINPTPDIDVTASPDTLCNGGTANFTLSTPNTSTSGTWAYSISATLSNPALAGYTTALDTSVLSFSDMLVNPTTELQYIDYTFHPFLLNPTSGKAKCDNGAGRDTTVRVWVNPTPRIAITASSDTLCNSETLNINITSLNPSVSGIWAYDIAVVASDGSVTGYSNASDVTSSILNNTLINPTNNVQWVRYTFTPKIIDPQTGTSYCLNGVDTTLQIWINPTPDISAVASPDTLCNNGTVNFAIANLNAGTTGTWAYSISAAPSDPSISGYTTALDTSVLSFSDVLVNPTTELQYIDYTFHPIIVMPTAGKTNCDNGTGNDTIIRVWINPTPRIAITASSDTLCNNETLSVNISSSNPSVSGIWAYDITAVTSHVSVSGYSTATDATNGILNNTLINPTNDLQWVRYTFTPKIIDPETGTTYCLNGIDTTLQIWINPTPDIHVIAAPDTLCNNGTINFTISNLNAGTTGTWAYDITANLSSPALSGYTTAQDTSVLSFSDILVNPTTELQYIDYTFHPIIVNPASGKTDCDNGTGNDTTIRVWINPTPRIAITASSDTLCNDETVTLSIGSLNPSVSGIWAYDISVLTSDASISGYTTATDTNASLIYNTLNNPTNNIQWVRYTFTPKVINPATGAAYCLFGEDTTLQIWINPTPDISVIATPDTLCNQGTTGFSISNLNAGTTGRWAYSITVMPSSPSLSGYTTTQDTSALVINDILFNPTNELQYIDYTFHPIIVDPTVGKANCDNGAANDTTIRVWINPSANLNALVSADTICNNSPINFTISNSNGHASGTWIYDLQVLRSSSSVSGYTESSNSATLSFIDVLTNTSDTAQWVDYHFHPKYYNPQSGLSYCDNGTINDTTIRVWVEPTAKVLLTHLKDTICSGLTFDPVKLISITAPTVDIRFDYQVIPENPGLVNIVNNSPIVGLVKDDVIRDSVYNLSDTIQQIKLVITPYLIDNQGGAKCSGIKDSVIIQLTPSLIMQDSARSYIKYNIDCHGNATGAVYMYPKGGILAFGNTHFDLNHLDFNIAGPGVSSPLYDSISSDLYQVDSLTAGTYALQASDFSGCIATDNIELTEPSVPLGIEIYEIIPIICDSDVGKVGVRKTGGTFFTSGPDTLGYETANWARFGFGGYGPYYSDTIHTAYPGDYRVSLRDTNGCLANDYTNLSGLGSPSFLFYGPTKTYNGYTISCTGASDGELTAIGSDLSIYLQYDLANADSSIFIKDSAKATGIVWQDLPAGNYTISVYNSEGCKNTVEQKLIEPADTLRINDYSLSWYHDNAWNVSCNWSTDGSVTISSITGGRSSYYTYEWTKDGSPYGSTQNLANIGYGNYQLIVSDGYCADTLETAVIAPTLLEFNGLSINHNICFGGLLGSIDARATGGELFGGSYDFSWSHSPTLKTNLAENLSSQIYTVTVKDSIGCSIDSTIAITEPAKLLIGSSISDYNGFEIACNGGNQGKIQITPAGGTGAINYAWEYNGSAFPGTSTIDSLLAGTYHLILSDQNNCEADTIFEMHQPDAIGVEFTHTPKICNTYGTALASANGGVILNGNTYSYYWSTLQKPTTFIDNLVPGKYPIEVSDDNNCIALDTVIILENSTMQVEIVEDKSISCFNGNDGILHAQIKDGTAPLSFKWNNIPGSQQLLDASEGEYIVEVSDNNECRDADTLIITQPDKLISNTFVNNLTCYNSSDGTVEILPQGGTGDYHIYFENNLIEESIVDGLKAGEYTIRVIDEKQCAFDTLVHISQPDSLRINENIAERLAPRCPDSPDGVLYVNAEGGTAPYYYDWIEQNISGNSLDNIAEGTYTVVSEDANGCIAESSIFLKAQMPACLEVPSAFSPNGDTYNDWWEIVNPLEKDMDLSFIYPNMVVKIFNRWGDVVWVSERGYPKSHAWTGRDEKGKSLPVDSYHYIIYLNNGSGETLNGIVTIVK